MQMSYFKWLLRFDEVLHEAWEEEDSGLAYPDYCKMRYERYVEDYVDANT